MSIQDEIKAELKVFLFRTLRKTINAIEWYALEKLRPPPGVYAAPAEETLAEVHRRLNPIASAPRLVDLPQLTKTVIGLDSARGREDDGMIEPGETRDVVSPVVMPFKAEKLAIDPACANSFQVNGFINGGERLAVSATPIAGRFFQPNSPGKTELPTTTVGQCVGVSVTNTGLAPRRFVGGYSGVALNA